MKISEKLKGIDNKPVLEQINILKSCIVELSKNLDILNPDKVFNDEYFKVKSFIESSNKTKWLTIYQIKDEIGDINLSNTRIGTALKDLNIIKKRAKIRMPYQVKHQTYWVYLI